MKLKKSHAGWSLRGGASAPRFKTCLHRKGAARKGVVGPKVPLLTAQETPKKAYGKVRMTQRAALWDNLPEPVRVVAPNASPANGDVYVMVYGADGNSNNEYVPQLAGKTQKWDDPSTYAALTESGELKAR